MKKVYLTGLVVVLTMGSISLPCKAETIERGQCNRPYFVDGINDYIVDSDEQIRDEIMYGEWEEGSQLVEAEAGNQSLKVKRLVADVLFNRLDSSNFPDVMHEVIFQEKQFSVVRNGAFDKAAWNMKDTDFDAVMLEADKDTRLNTEVLYFNNGDYVEGTTPLFKEGDLYFSK